MQISQIPPLTPLNQPVGVNNKRVSFGSDEFINSGITQTYAQAKTAIQKKFQPQISDLRAQRKAVAEDARNKIMDYLASSTIVKGFVNVEFLTGDTQNKRYLYEKLCQNPKTSAPSKAVFDIRDRIRGVYENQILDCVDKQNAIMIETQDYSKAEDLFNTINTSFKAEGIYPTPSMPNNALFDRTGRVIKEENVFFTKFKKNPAYNPKIVENEENRVAFILQKTMPYRLDFKKLEDTMPSGLSIDDMQEAFLNALEQAEENYKKTGRSTVLYVENMEKMISKSNSDGNLACMRDMLSRSGEDFHTTVVFPNSNPAGSQETAIACHRVGYTIKLDELGVTKKEISLFRPNTSTGEMIPYVDDVYREANIKYVELSDKIEELQTQCKEEISRLDKKSFPSETAVKQQAEKLEQKTAETASSASISNSARSTIKNLAKNKKVQAALALSAALFTAAMVMYKKGVFKKIKTGKNNPAHSPVSDASKTSPALKTSKDAKGADEILQNTGSESLFAQNLNASNVFSDFYKE